MADGIRRLVFNDTNNCPICLERCENPKVLSCLHSFCSNCLFHISRFIPPGSSFQCPLCLQANRVPNGGTDGFYDIKNLRQLVRAWLNGERIPPVSPEILTVSQSRSGSVGFLWLIAAVVVVFGAALFVYNHSHVSIDCQQSFENELLNMEYGIDAQTRRQLSQAHLMHALTFKVPKWGVATFGSRMFLVGQGSSRIEVYDIGNWTAKPFSISVPGLGTAADMVIDTAGTYLYISDSLSARIHRVTLSTYSVGYWSVNDQPHGLSVNAINDHLLVTFPETGTVEEFTSSGSLVRQIDLGPDIVHPWHTVRLGYEDEETGVVYLVTHGGRSDVKNRACRINRKGETMECLQTFITPLSSPIRAQLVGNHVIVADENNRRVLMMTKDLARVWTLTTELRGAIRMWFDNDERRLSVIINKWQGDSFVSAELRVFQIL